MRLCAITNVYNESFNLPIWLRHYGREVGAANCIVIDHGSTDGSTADLPGVGVIRLPRTPFDDRARAAFVSTLVGSLLGTYDWVLYTDCDELLVADPRKYGSLAELCAASEGPAVTAIGLNLVHHLGIEGPIRGDQPILAQRSYVQFSSSMCKTLLVREPVSWGGGFHSSNFEPRFDHLYLFHLRPVDLGESLRRLDTTRRVEFADENAGIHQRLNFIDHTRRMLLFPGMPIHDSGFSFEAELGRFHEQIEFSHTNRYYVREQFNAKALEAVPAEFKASF